MLFSHSIATNLVFCVTCVWIPLSYGHGAYHDVVEEITRSLETEPDNAALRFRLACAHQEHQEWTSALVELEKVERLAPGDYEVAYIQGQALAIGEKWAAAKTVLDEFLQTQPSHTGALAQRAKVLLKLGQSAEALADFRVALADPKQATHELYLEVAKTLELSGEKTEALEVLRRSLELHGSEPSLLMKSLQLELDAGHFDEALSRVDVMRKTAPRPEPWMARRAEILSRAKRDDEAKAAWSALRDHLFSLPNLERGMPMMRQLLIESQKALGITAPAPVMDPPLSSPPPATISPPP